MWNKKSAMKNRFLQLQLPEYTADAINGYVLNEFNKIQDKNEPVQQIKSIQPLKSKILGQKKFHLSYGSWGLPNLIKEICSDDSRIQNSAMTQLSELLVNDLERRRAILEFDIVGRLQNIFLRRLQQKYKNQNLIPIILKCFEILSFTLKAALQMSMRSNLIRELYTMASRGEHSKISSFILKNLTEHPQVLDYFIHETSWFNEISKILHSNILGQLDGNFLEHLSHFLKIYPEIGFKKGFFRLFLDEICKNQENQQNLLKCFAFLLNSKDGELMLDKFNEIILVLFEILMNEHLKSYEYIVQAFLSATAGSRKSLLMCANLQGLPEALIRRAHSKENERQQLYALQALRQITTLPAIKKYVRKNCILQIENIECRNASIYEAKKNLLTWLKTDTYNR